MCIEKKKANYKADAHRYGIFPLLYLLEEYEDNGNYEECHILLEVLQEKSDEEANKNSAKPVRFTHIRQVAESIKRKYLSPNIKEQVKLIKESQQQCLVK